MAFPNLTVPILGSSVTIPWWVLAGAGGAVVLAVTAEDNKRYRKRAAATHDFNVRVQAGARKSLPKAEAEAARQERAIERARRAADRERERAERLTARATTARTPSRSKAVAAKAATAEHRVERLDDIAARLERGEIKGSELKELMVSGTLATRKNPDDGAALDAALRKSSKFHGAPSEVVELTDAERAPLSRYAVVLGPLHSLVYGPDEHSQRGGDLWEHLSGDRGAGKPKSRAKPLLVADPVTGQVAIVRHHSPMKFDPAKGLVG